MEGEQASGRFPLEYAGTPSRFEGRGLPHSVRGQARLRVLAADPAGNTGVHEIPLRIDGR